MSVSCPKHKIPCNQSAYDYPRGSGNFGFYCTATDPLGKKGRCNFQANADGSMRTPPAWGPGEVPQDVSRAAASPPAPSVAPTPKVPEIAAPVPSRTVLRMAALEFAGRVCQGMGGESGIETAQSGYDFLLTGGSSSGSTAREEDPDRGFGS